MISIIAAMARNRVIGIGNTLPWHLPADLKHFKATTLGKPVVMGRLTYDSIGKPLPGRNNVVISRDPALQIAGVTVVGSLEQAITLLKAEHPEIMVIGGASLYQQALPCADRLYLTLIDAEVEGDAWFVDYNRDDWQEIAREDHAPDAANRYRYSFVTLQRRTTSNSLGSE